MSATDFGAQKHSKLRPLWITLKIVLTLFLISAALVLAGGGYVLHRTGIGGAMWALAREQGLVWTAYVDPLTAKEMRQKALAGFADQLDAHSQYMPPVEEREFMEQINGSFGGVGVAFGARKGQAVALIVYPDSPAAKAGIKTGDVLLSAENHPIDAKNLIEELRNVRGPVGTTVHLTMARQGKELAPFAVKREQIDTPSVASTVIPADKSPTGKPVALIQLREFTNRTPEELGATLEKLFAGDTPPTSLIIDERRNPGGVLSSSVATAAFFLPTSATVVSSLGRGAADPRGDDANTQFWKAQAADYWSGPADMDPVQKTHGAVKGLVDSIPIAVLIDSSSASAAEIFAGALKDNNRAVIVGQNSFGKGSVQQIFPLGEDGAIKFTVSRYYTPSGKSIQALGVAPDIKAGDDDAALRESDLPRHLPAPKIDVHGRPVVAARSTDPNADAMAQAELLMKVRNARASQLANLLEAKDATKKAIPGAKSDDDLPAPQDPFAVDSQAKPSDPFVKAAMEALAAGKGKPGPLAPPPAGVADKGKAASATSEASKAAAVEMSLVDPKF